MITLITGVPGAGKTLYCVNEILLPESAKGRQIFVDGIPDLQVPHELAGDVNTWHDWAPEGAHIVIDEVQRVWRPEAAGRAIPEAIAQLETHRHRGLDFTIMTQGPTLLHANVRRLVGRHIHIRRTPLGVYVYEWSECKNAPDSAWKSAISKTRWSHPKKSFSLYKSASVHQKVHFRMPKAVYVVGIGLSLLPVLGYGLYSVFSHSLADFASSAPKATSFTGQQTLASTQQQAPTSPMTPVTASSPPGALPAGPADVDLREAFVPRIYGEPNTAPAYDHLRIVQNMPAVTACIASADECRCYTEQMTRVEMTNSQCREHVQRRVYDPYSDMPKAGAVGGETTAPTPAPTRES